MKLYVSTRLRLNLRTGAQYFVIALIHHYYWNECWSHVYVIRGRAERTLALHSLLVLWAHG